MGVASTEGKSFSALPSSISELSMAELPDDCLKSCRLFLPSRSSSLQRSSASGLTVLVCVAASLDRSRPRLGVARPPGVPTDARK